VASGNQGFCLEKAFTPTMKRFAWKITFCLLPVLLAATIVGFAYSRYRNGEGGFKLGVDLAGGTDLIYEVDMDKFTDEKARNDFDPQELAATLKRRIDPADLYNITIRPIGKFRVEIILPTGGSHQADAEEKVWQGLLTAVAEHWPPTGYHVPVGQKIELLALVNAQYPDVKTGDIEAFINQHYHVSATATQPEQEAAWKNLITDVQKQWPPVRYEVGRGSLQILVNRVREQHPEASVQQIGQFIDSHYNLGKEKRQLTTEEVQHIKELIAQVGKLEFRILANSTDDKEAIEAAKKYFADAQKDPNTKRTLDDLAVAGKPPPPPLNAGGSPDFPVVNDSDAPHSYAWVELGRSERQSLGLNNKAANDPSPNSFWKQAAAARDKGETLPVLGGCLLYSRKVENPRLPPDEADKKYEYFILTREAEPKKEITGDYLVDAYPTTGSTFQLEVAFRFNAEGGRLFHELTTKNAPSGSAEGAFRRYLAVILDNKIESAPRLNAVISTDGVIEGRFTKDEVDRLAKVLKSGRLKASLKPLPVSENTIGPTLGADTIRKGAISVGIAFVAILAFMLVYYRFAGLVACTALLANLLLTVAFMVLVNATFTLPGLAGLVLMLGMAVDANVLIYERLREERDRGASLALAIRNGYDRAFPVILDTHLSSIFTAIVLYLVGNDQLKGFGISLTVGLIISLFTSLYMTRLLFDIWHHQGWLRKLSMFRLLSRPNFDFMAIRYYWFTATIILTVLGASLFFYRLDRGGLNIDFIGGTAYGGKLKEMVDAEQLRDLLSKVDLPDLSVGQIFVDSPDFSQGNRSKLFTILTSDKDSEAVQLQINRALGNLLAKTDLGSYDIPGKDPVKEAVLSFVNPDTKNPDFASRAQVGMLLARQFEKEGLQNAAQQFLLEGLGKEEDGRFQWMDLQLIQPIERSKMESVIKATQSEFAARPQPERLEVFDSQLARDTQLRALRAILASWAAILLYLWFRFGNWTFGLAAVLCLIHDLFFTLGGIALAHYIHMWWPGLASALLIDDFKIDLPAVAALLTLVGYSVNDTIVVFDRIREVRGKNPLLTPQMINDSVNQTLSRTLLTAFSVWLVVIVLYIWGGEGIHLFSFVMVIGVIVGTYSSIYIASPLLLIFGEGAPKATVRKREPETQTATV
jgi:SecD/SecF fusion protein